MLEYPGLNYVSVNTVEMACNTSIGSDSDLLIGWIDFCGAFAENSEKNDYKKKKKKDDLRPCV